MNATGNFTLIQPCQIGAVKERETFWQYKLKTQPNRFNEKKEHLY